ncbi:hypothetical protein D9613_005135 [Agrocybe pediades]|uniref:RlpA-like protein double-psi beta-barrel domain-containing protein n=1 Tax=Agrocybe pediades TaxID=84607 RepID=A0A8H4QZ10_9AGAR|nr:hypothetical protein D9613_005135 [Agrocybe pediades]KAF9568964.1 Non-catalytic module family EXPN protein [Agrocybe pediades]
MLTTQLSVGIIFIAFCFVPAFAGRATSIRAISKSKYTTAHSLGDDYRFDPRDGWQSINVTDLGYKYRRQLQPEGYSNDPARDGVSAFENRSTRKKSIPKKHGLSQAISGVLKNALQGLKGVGKPEQVTITWYTGHDLKNPSCWTDGRWSPTDASFACALTMEGWTTRPKCFKFLELCNTPKKCVFVRVVDTCAGCAPGSKHVDLTRAAFGQLASFDEGVLQVQLRPATEPHGWYEELWGPKMD